MAVVAPAVLWLYGDLDVDWMTRFLLLLLTAIIPIRTATYYLFGSGLLRVKKSPGSTGGVVLPEGRALKKPKPEEAGVLS